MKEEIKITEILNSKNEFKLLFNDKEILVAGQEAFSIVTKDGICEILNQALLLIQHSQDCLNNLSHHEVKEVHQ